jgi:hypothetical protein
MPAFAVVMCRDSLGNSVLQFASPPVRQFEIVQVLRQYTLDGRDFPS